MTITDFLAPVSSPIIALGAIFIFMLVKAAITDWENLAPEFKIFLFFIIFITILCLWVWHAGSSQPNS